MGTIVLREATSNDDYIFIRNLFYSEPGIREIFSGKESRLICVFHNFIIELDNKPIGFINTVNEHLDKFLFVDMGIMENYCGKGYGKRALLELRKFYLSKFPNYRYYLIGETRCSNDPANVAALKTGMFLLKNNDLNYYLINEDRYDDLKDSGYYDSFIDHINKTKLSSRSIYHEIMESESNQRK